MATCKHTSSSSQTFVPGQTITGIWNKRRYFVESLLGRGANGEVYRVQSERGETLALKLSPQANEMALEHKLLQQLQGVAQGVDLGPLVFDLDDVRTKEGKQFFYVMERVRGTSLPAFLQERGAHWLPVLLLQLCTYLERLHALGYCFGDLKAENCLVDEAAGRLRLVDFGGVTAFSRGVKEYTEWYDRAWWGQGSRRAEASYDVFALSMMVVALISPERQQSLLQAGDAAFSHLRLAVESDPRFDRYRPLLHKIWSGRVSSVSALRLEMAPLVSTSVRLERDRKKKAQKNGYDWTDYLLLGSVALLVLLFCQFLFLS